MKQTNLLKTFLLLCALVVGSTCAWADSNEEIFANQFGFSSNTNLVDANATLNATKFSLTFAKNDANNAPAYNKNSEEFRLYKAPSEGKLGCSVTIAAAAGVTFTKVVFDFSNLPTNYSFSSGSYDKTKNEWTGSATSSLTLTNTDLSGQIKIVSMNIYYTEVAIPKHSAAFYVNGKEYSSAEVEEGSSIPFPATDPSSIGGKDFKGWVSTAIVGNVDVEPSYVSSATMGTEDINFYAVFAKASTEEGNATLTITKDTENFPTSYGTANTFTEYTLEGKKFKIQQAYINGGKLQWRASGNSNGTGTMYNTEAINKIQSVALTYNSSDGNKNFTVEIGDAENPTGGTAITPTNSGLVYTFDCSTYNKNYFVLTNGTGAGYLDKIDITYKGAVTVYSAYCTTVTVSTPAVTAAGWATYVTPYNMEFAEGDAFVVSAATASTATLAPVTKIGANKAVLLKGEGVKTATVLNEAPDAVVANELAISTGGEIDGFVLAKKNDKVGFYKWAGGSLTSGKVYLPAPAGARDYLEFSFDETTALTLVNSEKRTVNSDIYNLAGQRVAQPTKGLYIVNGKKVVIK